MRNYGIKDKKLEHEKIPQVWPKNIPIMKNAKFERKKILNGKNCILNFNTCESYNFINYDLQ